MESHKFDCMLSSRVCSHSVDLSHMLKELVIRLEMETEKAEDEFSTKNTCPASSINGNASRLLSLHTDTVAEKLTRAVAGISKDETWPDTSVLRRLPLRQRLVRLPWLWYKQ